MAIVRFDPFRELASMQDRINRIFGEAYRRGDDDITMRADWAPAVDIFENDQHEIVIKAEMPGLKKEDIHVTVHDGILTISGERKAEKDINEGTVHRTERFYGKFSRSVSLPSAVKSDKVLASYKDGVLTVEVPKADEAKPRNIEVKIS